MQFRSEAVIAFLLLACSEDVCPSELAADSEWIARTPEPECVELAEALNDQPPLDQAELEMSAKGDQCVAELSARGVEIECEVSSSGAADCEARIQTDGLDCALLLRLR